jgi:hypothetical protein
MRPLHKPFLSIIALISLCVSAAVAQHPVSRALIREKVDENQLTMLRGNTPPAAIAQNDAGPVSGNMALTGLILVLQRSPEMQAAFDAFVESQYEPNSPNFHQWLTPEQIGEQFGPATSDITKVTNWLGSHGLAVNEVSKDRMTIRFSGTARQVEATFHTQLHNLSVRGKAHFSNMSDPQIPMALEPVVLGPKALHNFIPRPLHRTRSIPTLNNAQSAKTPSVPGANASGIGLRPDMGFSCGSNCQLEEVAPADFAAIYNVAPVWSSGIDGTGQTIAIAGRSDVRASDVTKFRSTFGLSGGTYTQINNGTDPGNCTSTASNALCTLDDQIENALDVEWSGAMAPKATVKLIVTEQTSGNDAIFESAKYVVNNVGTVGAKILNVSYGNCELFLGTSGNTSWNQLWQSAASAGIAVFVATGDSGSPACDQGYDSISGTPYGAQFGLAVSGIASTPFNTAVGGTDLNWGNTASPYWNSSNNGTSGGSAKGYIPETPWNNSCSNPLALSYFQSWATQLKNSGFSATSPTDSETACNFVATWYQTIASNTNPTVDLSNFVDSVGAGGGKSNCTTNSSTNTTIGTCTASGYSKPSWQTGVSGIPSDGKRDLPDVSFFAGNGFLGSAYFMCVTDWGPCLSSATATSEPTDTSGNTVNLIGGTSAASPAMAGIMALINQKAGSTQGNPNKTLYTLAAAQSYSNCKTESVTNSSSCYFNDIDTGTISMPCQAGAQDCSVTHSGNTWGILSGFTAGAGYDAATGLGSMNVANVVNGWSGSVGTTPTTITVTPTPGTILSNQSVSVVIAVAGGSGTPTGTINLTGGGYNPAAQSLTAGSATFNIPGNTFAAGTVVLTATYSGDSTYGSNTATGQVIVNAAPAPTVMVSPAASSINSGQSLSVPVTLTGASGTPTGNVTLSGGGYTSSAQALASGATTFNIPANSLSGGTVTLTASYAGDTTYGVATGTANVTVTQSTFTLAATAPAAVNRGSSAASTITWTTSNNFSTTIKLGTCTLNTGAPANSSADTPKCTVSSTSFDSTGSGTATVTTSAATTGALQKPHIGGWAEAGSGAILAVLVFFGIPARRRGWRAMLGMFVILFALSGLVACGGGGGSSSGGGGTSDPGTASGTYTFTLTGVGNDAAHTTATTTFSVKVN